jgi:hypothetical protein
LIVLIAHAGFLGCQIRKLGALVLPLGFQVGDRLCRSLDDIIESRNFCAVGNGITRLAMPSDTQRRPSSQRLAGGNIQSLNANAFQVR